MKALITDGAGFIGSNPAPGLIRDGHEITVLDNLLSGYRENLSDLPARFVEGDVRDAVAVNQAMARAEVVFHLAASVGRPVISST